MKLTRTVETSVGSKVTWKKSHHVIKLTADVKCEEDVRHLTLDYFKVILYIDGLPVADISKVLGKTDALKAMVDEHDWVEVYNEEKSK